MAEVSTLWLCPGAAGELGNFQQGNDLLLAQDSFS